MNQFKMVHDSIRQTCNGLNFVLDNFELKI